MPELGSLTVPAIEPTEIELVLAAAPAPIFRLTRVPETLPVPEIVRLPS